MRIFTESVVEQAAIAWLESTGWAVKNGTEIAPGELGAERDDYGQVVLAQRLRDALARLNPGLPAETLDDAFRQLTRPEGAELVARSRALHREQRIRFRSTFNRARFDAARASADALLRDDDKERGTGAILVAPLTIVPPRDPNLHGVFKAELAWQACSEHRRCIQHRATVETHQAQYTAYRIP